MYQAVLACIEKSGTTPGDFRDFQEIQYTRTLLSFRRFHIKKVIAIRSGRLKKSKNPLNKLCGPL